MKKYFSYLIIYSFLGYILERIINLFVYGELTDGGLMNMPLQPLYGVGIVLAILINDFFISKLKMNNIIKNLLLLVVAIMTTALSEAVTGFGYYYITEISLWDYGEFFTCTYKYVCVIPTSLFGLISFLSIKFFHNYFKDLYLFVNNYYFIAGLLVFLIDCYLVYYTAITL